EADEIETAVSDRLQFFDCAENFERVLCPGCGAEIGTTDWQAWMASEEEDEYPITKRVLPCCGVKYKLHELTYQWPGGIGRFALEERNCNIGELSKQDKAEFERILACPIRVIYQHV